MTGFLLDSAWQLPPPETFRHQLSLALPQFQHLEWRGRTDSTNAELMQRARSGEETLVRPWLLGTHLQDRGRGRAGRTWQNRAGANLMFSCAFDLFLPTHALPALSPLIGVASCHALRTHLSEASQPRLTMKWPNDLLWDQAKLAGILIESTRASTSGASDHHLIVIGIGLNLLDARALSQSLYRRIADWSQIAQQDAVADHTSSAALVTSLTRAWRHALDHATSHGLSGLPACHALVDSLAGRSVDVLDDGRLLRSGVACGLDAHGRLLIRNTNGVHPVSVGEISVRVSA